MDDKISGKIKAKYYAGRKDMNRGRRILARRAAEYMTGDRIILVRGRHSIRY
jgi:hypothetical protein